MRIIETWLVPHGIAGSDFYGRSIIGIALCRMMGWVMESEGSNLFGKMASVFGQGI